MMKPGGTALRAGRWARIRGKVCLGEGSEARRGLEYREDVVIRYLGKEKSRQPHVQYTHPLSSCSEVEPGRAVIYGLTYGLTTLRSRDGLMAPPDPGRCRSGLAGAGPADPRWDWLLFRERVRDSCLAW